MFDKHFSAKDFSLYFCDCITSAKIKDEKRPVYLNGCSSTGEITAKVFLDEDEVTDLVCSWEDKEEVFNFIPLSKGAINMPQSVVYLRNGGNLSSPWRYKKLPNTRDTRLLDPFYQERILLNSPPAKKLLSGYILNAWVKNTFVPAHEAFENVLTFKRMAQAWSPEWFIGLHYKTNSPVVFRRNYIIGRVNQETGEIRLKPAAHSLSDELSEYGLTVRKISS